MRSRLVCALVPLHAQPVENVVVVGYPDVEFIGGLLECKWLRNWPARSATPVRLQHYTNAQRDFLRDRWDAGGACGLMLQCRIDWLLFDAPAAQLVGTLPREQLYEAACWRTTRFDYDKPALVDYLKNWRNRP